MYKINKKLKKIIIKKKVKKKNKKNFDLEYEYAYMYTTIKSVIIILRGRSVHRLADQTVHACCDFECEMSARNQIYRRCGHCEKTVSEKTYK